MQFQTLSVTPEIASRWLESNDKNRRISWLHVRKLAQIMQSGAWALNGQTVSFDDNGRLLDGQHRLNAVVQSGMTVPMAIAVGVNDPEAFKTYDELQLKRGAHHIAGMMGVADANKVAACARIVLAWEKANTPDQFAAFVRQGFNDARGSDIAEKAHAIEGKVRDAHNAIGKSLPKSSGAESVVLAMLVIFFDEAPLSATLFANKLKSGVCHSSEDPCLHLRDRLIAGRGSTPAKEWKSTLAALMVKAFNAHCEGRHIKALRFRQEGPRQESFPKLSKRAC